MCPKYEWEGLGALLSAVFTCSRVRVAHWALGTGGFKESNVAAILCDPCL